MEKRKEPGMEALGGREDKEGMKAFGGRDTEEQSRGRPMQTKMTLGSGSVLPRKGESLHGLRPSTWCLHLRRVSGRVVIQSQDAEGVKTLPLGSWGAG